MGWGWRQSQGETAGGQSVASNYPIMLRNTCMSKEIHLIWVSYKIYQSLKFLTLLNRITKLKTFNKEDLYSGRQAVHLPNITLAFQIPVSGFSSKRAHSQSHGIWLNTQGPQLHTAHLAADKSCNCRFCDKVGNASLGPAEHPWPLHRNGFEGRDRRTGLEHPSTPDFCSLFLYQ